MDPLVFELEKLNQSHRLLGGRSAGAIHSRTVGEELVVARPAHLMVINTLTPQHKPPVSCLFVSHLLCHIP